MQKQKHSHYLLRRVICMCLAMLMVLSTVITGFGQPVITAHAATDVTGSTGTRMGFFMPGDNVYIDDIDKNGVAIHYEGGDRNAGTGIFAKGVTKKNTNWTTGNVWNYTFDNTQTNIPQAQCQVVFSNAVVCSDGNTYDLLIRPFKDDCKPQITVYSELKSKSGGSYKVNGKKGYYFGARVPDKYVEHTKDDGSTEMIKEGSYRFGMQVFIIEHGTKDNPKPVEMHTIMGLADMDQGEGLTFYVDNNFKIIHQGSKVKSKEETDKSIVAHGKGILYYGTSGSNGDEQQYNTNCIFGEITIPEEGLIYFYRGNGKQTLMTFEQLGSYCVSFNDLHGDANVPPVIMKPGDGTADTVVMGKAGSQTPTREGYVFKGWATEKEYSASNKILLASDTSDTSTFKDYCDKVGASTTVGSGDEAQPLKILTLYAQWEPADPDNPPDPPTPPDTPEPEKYSYSVSFDANGGSGSTPSTISKEGENSSVTMGSMGSEVPTRDGYVFKGWSATKEYSSSNKIIQSSDTGSSTTFKDYCDKTGGSDSGKSLTLYAQWKQQTTYTVTYDANGGSGDIPAGLSKTVDDADANTVMGATENKVPVKEGHVFKGWSATKDYNENNKIFNASDTDANTTFQNYCDKSGGNASSTALTVYAQWEQYRKIGVKKTSSGTLNGGTLGNSCYADLGTSEYTIYTDEAATQAIGTVKGDGKDYIEAPSGTYYIKETKAPVGYYIDPVVHKVDVAGDLWSVFSDDPMDDPFTITAQKSLEGRDTAGEITGDVPSLAGIQFEVSYYKGEYSSMASLPATADESAIFQTDASGMLSLDKEHMVPGNTWKYLDDSGRLTFPLGTIAIREKSAVTGLKITYQDGNLFTITDKSDKTNTKITALNYHGDTTNMVSNSDANATNGDVASVYENSAKKGGVTVYKVDRELNKNESQGDATLIGTEFTIYNRSNNSVSYKGNVYGKDEAIGVITTGYDSATNTYIATTGSDALEYGSYEIVETKAPEGYVLNDWSAKFTIREDNQQHIFNQQYNMDVASGIDYLHGWCSDRVFRGGVTFAKVDNETRQPISLGAANINGATFQLINKSIYPVYINKKMYKPDEVIMELVAAEMDVKTADGSYQTVIGNTTGNNILPYGTYELREVSSGIGYICGTGDMGSKTFSIRADGEMHYFINPDEAIGNQVQRSDMSFIKRADDTGKGMAGVAWKVTSMTTGETHVIVTREDGIYDSSMQGHSQNTNANDPDSSNSNGAIAVNEDGDYYVADQSALDLSAGTWFTGLAPEKTKWAADGTYKVEGMPGPAVSVNDALGAFPYDIYTVEELSGEANEGYNRVSFIADLRQNGTDPDGNNHNTNYGTVTDKHADMYTTLGFNLTGFSTTAKSVPSMEGITITDTVIYTGLTAGEDYTVKGELHLIDADGNDEGVVASNEMTFTAKGAGRFNMDFALDTTGYVGKKLVAVEEIWQGGTLLVKEDDLENRDQTVWIAGITGTKASKSWISVDEPITITDEISYTNLEIGMPYTVNMTLVDASGEPVRDKDGNEVTAEKMFVPGVNSGTETMTVTFEPSENLVDTTAVVFEEIRRGIVFGEHKDLNDKNQTVVLADMVDTYAANADTFTKEIGAEPGQSIYDAVRLRGLESDKQYRLRGIIYTLDEDGNLGVILDSKGRPVVKIIDNPKDRNVMIFDGVDASELAGMDIVVHQTLYARESDDDEWELVWRHCDNEDADQIVHVPGIETELLAEGGIHTSGADGKVTLIDTITYRNLVPGQKYTAKGTLKIRDDVENKDGYRPADGWKAVEVGDVEDVVSEVEFTPSDRNGSIDVTFMFNAADLQGKVVVAYEEIYTEAGYERPDDWSEFFDDLDWVYDLCEDLGFDGDWSVGAVAGKPRLVMSHTDIGDPMQAVGFANIKATTLTTFKGTHTEAPNGEVSFTDVVEYEGLIPNTPYNLTGSLYVKGEKEPFMTVENPFTPEKVSGEVDVTFTFDAAELGLEGKTVVAFEVISYEDIKLASHEDMEDAAQSVSFMSLDTVLTGVKDDNEETGDEETDETVTNTGYEIVEFNVYPEKQESEDGENEEETEVPEQDTAVLVDTIAYTNLTPGTEYTLKGELHLKGNFNDLHDIMESDLDMGRLYERPEMKFTPETANGTIDVEFRPLLTGITKADLVAFEYLYDGDELVIAHNNIKDRDQTVTVVNMNGVKPGELNPCGCDDPDCKHKDEEGHCLNPGCCKDDDCCKDCEICKHRNPCGCCDPECKHKDEVDHCKDNPHCCDDSDCCKECDDCYPVNPCGCRDLDCKHKDEEGYCKEPGCCKDDDCCKECDQCSPKNPCGCRDPECTHKDEEGHCNEPGCCKGDGCCKECDQCNPKNPCGCRDPECAHANEKDACLKAGCCAKDKCCKKCDDCKPANKCGCTDPNCKNKDKKNACKKAGCCDGEDCCKNCDDCKPKNPCGCTDPNCKNKNIKNHCMKKDCCKGYDCCKNCKECKSSTSSGGNNNNGNTDNKNNGGGNNGGNGNNTGNNGNNTGNNGNSGNKGNTSTTTKNPTQSTTTTTKNPVQQVIEVVKTGQETFLLMGIIGLAVMSGGAYFFFAKTAKGRKLFQKLRDKLKK